MRMTLQEAGIRNAYKLGMAEFFDVVCTAVSHTGAEASDHLIDDLRDSTLVRNLGDDALRNQLLDVLFHILEITVLGTMLHRLEGTHAPIGLEAAAVHDDCLARGLFGTCEQGTGHDGAGACRESLHDVARISVA